MIGEFIVGRDSNGLSKEASQHLDGNKYLENIEVEDEGKGATDKQEHPFSCFLRFAKASVDFTIWTVTKFALVAIGIMLTVVLISYIGDKYLW